ncbi:MAG: DUF748 domain-containing protein [Desulfobulbus sp.]|jgi:uncharacterized protein involved in outer membrane biogenesis|uniref:DUF748 domain-containing protein n=1 Tax=Desulfobulbus sp. TaxID=895 RepID=UPI0028502650|nr:DUF748 domain-containing protein [Desulfobulbus sp.]MDR2548798.1 DUF748 domain-containing protein [Desulfobulbus sp.]
MRKALRKVVTGKWFVAAVGLVSLYALTGFLGLPFLLIRSLPHLAEQNWHCRAEVESIRLNPFLLTVEIKGLSLRQADGQPLLSFDRFFVDLETESLWRRALVLRELTLVKPEVHLEIEPDGTLNLMRLVAGNQAKASPPSSSSLPFFLYRLDLREAALRLTDKRPAVPAVLALQGFGLEVDNCSTLPDQAASYKLAATVAEHGIVGAEGGFTLLPLRSQGHLAFKGIGLAKLWQFVPDSLNVDRPDGTVDLGLAYEVDAANAPARVGLQDVHLAASGLVLKLRQAGKTTVAADGQGRTVPAQMALSSLDCRLQAHLELGKGAPTVSLKDMAARIKGLKVAGVHAKEPLFAADSLSLEGGGLDLKGQKAVIERIALHNGQADVIREADGGFGWQRLGQGGKAGAPAKDKKSATTKQATAEPASGWKTLVKSFELEQFRIRFTDLTTATDKPVVSLRNVKAKLTGIDGSSPMGFAIGFQAEQGGSAAVSGTVQPAIPAVEAEIDLRGLALMSLQPYLEPLVRLKVPSALVSARGRLGYGLPKMPAQGSYEGSFALEKLRLVDAAMDKPYLSWDALKVPKCRLTLEPNRLEAQEITVVKPVSSIIVNKDKSLNLAQVIKEQPANQPGQSRQAPRPAPKKAGSPPDEDGLSYRIDRVRVEAGDLVFADLSLLPQFKTRIHDLGGTVVGLASAAEKQAKVQLEGRVDELGTAKISGVLRPSDFAKASDLNLVFRNLEMKNLSPYSGKFAGRLIKSGKISADLGYTLQDYKMTGNNKIVIDNLLLGDKVEAPEAGNLPLDLAIALLKDANGRIDIGLPVTGDLNDPHFSLGALVWKMLTNVITKAAAAPFMALGGLLGGNADQFESVAFAPGSRDLAPVEQDRLLKLAEALDRRPNLKLIVQGRYSPGIDGLELRERSVRRAVAALLGTKPGSDGTPELLDFSDGDTQDALEELYVKRSGKDALAVLDSQIETGAITPRMPAWATDSPRKEAGMAAKMIGGLQLYKVIPGGRSPEQATLRAGELYTRLVEQERASDEALRQLAQQRAETAIALLARQQRIPKERVGSRPPEPLADGEAPALTLSLDVL